MPQRMTILGAGTALPDAERDNTFMIWQSPGGSVLIDCAGRAFQQLVRAGIDPHTIHSLVLTHSHPDHIYGVPAFVFHLWLAGYARTLDIYANPSTLPMAKALCEALDLEQRGHMCKVAWHELSEAPDTPVLVNDYFSLTTTPVQHSVPTLGLKIADHRSLRTLVYTCDTEPHERLNEFTKGAHTIIHEATVNDPSNNHTHSTPFQAGETAKQAGAERLILIHFSGQYTMTEDEALAEVRRAGFGGEAEVARELAHYSA